MPFKYVVILVFFCSVFPVLTAILKDYELEHAQVAAGKSAKTLPRLFSLTPQPSRHWRFVSVDAHSSAMLTRQSATRNYEQNLSVFTTVFDMDKYGCLE